jgi:hypothetical protein
MKNRVIAGITFLIIIAGVIIAGCTGTSAPSATPTANPTVPPTVMATTVATVAQQPSFTLGDHYLQKPYTFSSEKDDFIEQFIVADPSWGIEFKVTPLVDDLQYCWFTMDVTNVNTGQVDHYGYGRTFSFEKDQMYPMYTTGSYKIEMKGNRAKVDVTVAKRNP